MTTDAKLKREVCEKLGVKRIKQKHWNMAVNIGLKDVYINYMCMGKDMPYDYFVHILATTLELLIKEKEEK